MTANGRILVLDRMTFDDRIKAKEHQTGFDHTMKIIEEFIKRESSAGITLMFVTAAALLLKNSPLSEAYNAFLYTPLRSGLVHCISISPAPVDK